MPRKTPVLETPTCATWADDHSTVPCSRNQNILFDVADGRVLLRSSAKPEWQLSWRLTPPA
ncbi:MAG: hypothetical protein ABI412_03700 [Sphingomicrobium sp.]